MIKPAHTWNELPNETIKMKRRAKKEKNITTINIDSLFSNANNERMIEQT